MGSTPKVNEFYNVPAKGVPFFTPAQNPPSGTLLEVPDGKQEPKLFTPLKIRGLTLQNRIMVSDPTHSSNECKPEPSNPNEILTLYTTR